MQRIVSRHTGLLIIDLFDRSTCHFVSTRYEEVCMHFALFLALFGVEKIDKNMDLYVNTKNSR